MKLKFLLLFSFAMYAQDNISIKSIMTEPFSWGYRVKNYQFTPDGKNLMFKERKKSVQLYKIETQILTHIDSLKSIPQYWISDKIFIQKKKNHFYDSRFDSLQKKLIYDSNAYGSDQSVTFRASKNHTTDLILVKNLLHISRNGHLSSLNIGSDDGYSYYISKLSNTGRFGVLVKYKNRKTRNWNLFFPNYLPQFTKIGKQNRGITKSEIILIDFDKLEHQIIFAQKEGGYIGDIDFYKDEQLVFINYPINRKKVSFYNYNLREKVLENLYNSKSNKWVVASYHSVSFSPNGKKVLFIALSNGYEKIFVRELSQKRNRLVSSRDEQITFANWLDNKNIIYSSNFPNPTERYFYILNSKNGKCTQLTRSSGYTRGIVLSSNKKYLAYQYSKLATPDELFLYDIKKQKEYQLTHTIPVVFQNLKIIPQKIIKTISADKKFTIYANFYSSSKMRKPLIVFVHGAGIMQNVRNGWTPYYYREFMFHQFLIQNDYHVLDVDYRGSKGYSNRFSTDVYSHLGKRELEDIVSFIDKLDKDRLIDRNKVAIYGGSYGGFMASYAMEFQPELFKAGAALRSVFKWENYFYTNEWYTRARLGLLKNNPIWYKRSSPIYHANKIKNPLLILHGVQDNNVPFQDAVQMIQQMVEHQKQFDLMIYPKEKHSFKNEKSWIDEYTRIFNYFELHLKGKK